jgi:hypothetical protein
MRYFIPSLILIALMASCRPSITGHWVNDSNDLAYHFQGDGQVTVTAFGNSSAARYRLVNGEVILTSPQGTVVLTLEDDQLIGPMAQRFTRQPITHASSQSKSTGERQ